MKHQAVIFDLDGTLLNTLEDLADSMNHVLQDRGLPTHPVDAYRRFIGNSARALASRALPAEKQQEETVTEYFEAFRRTYRHNWNVKTRPYQGIQELLNTLRDKHIKLAVLTNKPQDFAELCIHAFFPDGTFDVIQGQRDNVPIKPDPTGSLDVARHLNVLPQACLFIGDSDVDMQTAVRAAMFPVGVLWGYRSEQELRDNGALAVIQQPLELLEYIQ